MVWWHWRVVAAVVVMAGAVGAPAGAVRAAAGRDASTGTAAPAETAAVGPTAPSAAQAVARALASRRASEPLARRLEQISAAFLDVPYLDSPLGEGAGLDPDPLVRWDAVDCVTFVEQVLALAQAPSEDRLVPVLNDLRYADGQPAFENRNHLMMAQWVPHNLAKGWLVDVAAEVGGARVRRAEKAITPESWRLRKGIGLELPPERVPVGTNALSYLPVESILEVADVIPDGTLLLVVRKDLWTRPYRITHLGFVFHRNGTAWLRHAARVGYGRVVDERLDTFVRRNAAYRRWPVAGFALLRPVENPTRAAALGRDVAMTSGTPEPTRPGPSAGSRGG